MVVIVLFYFNCFYYLFIFWKNIFKEITTIYIRDNGSKNMFNM